MYQAVRSRHTSRHSEAGTSLADIIVAVVLLGIGVTALLNVWGTSISLSLHGRETSTIAALAVSAGEAVRDQNRNPYVNCQVPAPASPPIPNPPFYNPWKGIGTWALDPAPYNVQITAIRYWDGDSFENTCGDSSTLLRLQQITVTVTSTKDARVARTAVVVKRSPT